MKINYNIGNEKPMLLRFFPRRSIRPFDIVDLIVDRNGVMESFLNMQLKDHMLLAECKYKLLLVQPITHYD